MQLYQCHHVLLWMFTCDTLFVWRGDEGTITLLIPPLGPSQSLLWTEIFPFTLINGQRVMLTLAP